MGVSSTTSRWFDMLRNSRLLVRALPARSSTTFQQVSRRRFTSSPINQNAKNRTSLIQRNEARFNAHYKGKPRRPLNYFLISLVGYCLYVPISAFEGRSVNYDAIREDIESILDEEGYDDGSLGPVLIRLAWHSSGTACVFTKTGGSNGANMRFAPEKDHGANAGLDVARERLEQIKKKHPEITYADLYILASVVAIEAMGGPKIKFTPGRTDSKDNKLCTPDGRLPDASKGRDHIRAIFYRMGFNDEEMVALIGGGHALGRCHTDRSGYSGPWTNSPTMFTNDYFVQLLNNKWTEKKWDGPLQYEDESGNLMMLPADMELRDDPNFRKFSEKFAQDEEYFFEVFSQAYEKLTNLGCPFAPFGKQ